MKNIRCVTLVALGGIAVLASLLLILMLTDLGASSEPSWVERRIAGRLLSLKIGFARPRETAPSQLDASSLQHSLERYQRSCAFCHGNTDGQPALFASTLSPRPPQFFRDAEPVPAWRAAHIIRSGVRWTGMPAFPNLTEEEAWHLASMLESKVLAGTVEARPSVSTDPLGGLKPYLIGISVPEAQEAATWYEQKLGFKRGGSEKTSSGTVLIVEERPGFAVELLEVEDSFSIHRSNPDYDAASGKLQGMVKLGFAVDDLESALAELKRKEVRVLREITELQSLNVKFFLIADNNRNVIQIFQARNGQPQTGGAAKGP